MSEMQFEGQREGEKVEIIFRRHLLTTYKGWLWFLAMCGLGVVPMLLWKQDERMFWVFLSAVGLGVLGYVYTYILWYFSIFIVTNERLRQISQKGLTKKIVIDIPFEKIQNVAFMTSGIMANICNYGTLIIKLEAGDMVISKVKEAEKVYNKLQNVMGK